MKCILIALIVATVFALVPAGARQQSVLMETIKLTSDLETDPISAIGSLGSKLRFPLNLEIHCTPEQLERVKNQKVVLKKGEYSLKECLEKIKASLDKLSWRSRNKCVTVSMTLEGGKANPLDYEFKDSAEMTMSAKELIEWLNGKNPNLGLRYIDLSTRPLSRRVKIDIEKGQTIRDALSSFAENAGLYWKAVVYDKRQKVTVEVAGDPKSRQLIDGDRGYIMFFSPAGE